MTLALVGVIVPGVMKIITTVIDSTDQVYDRSVALELAQSQMEDVQRQSYQVDAASYTKISAPSGYSIAIAASAAVTYTYPAPKSTATVQTVQLVTVTVTGVRGTLALEAYKVLR